MPLQTLGPAQKIFTATESVERPTEPPEASAGQAPDEGSQRPPLGEKSFLLTVAQRAKEAAAAGATVSRYCVSALLQAGRLAAARSSSSVWHLAGA